jgi:hypothetical protein
MTAHVAKYHYLTCNGRLDNLVQPNCPATSPGVLIDETALTAAAGDLGWTRDGSRDYCPSCSTQRSIPESSTPKPQRKTPRARTEAEPPAVQLQDFQQ